MTGINWRGVFMCGLGAGLAWTFLSIPLLMLFGGDIVEALPRPLVTPGRIGSVALNVVAGIWAVWLYAAIRPRYSTRRTAAAIAGFSWWLIATINTWEWGDIGFVPLRNLNLAWLLLASLPALIAVTMLGALSYREGILPGSVPSTARGPRA